jgi:WD40 repeat protein
MKQDYKPFLNSKTNWLSAFCFVMFLFVSSSAFAQFYNGSQMEFGKNRVQYEKTDWFFYRFDRFDVYFYLGGGELAEYTMRASDRAIRDLEKTFDFTLDKRFQIIIYNKLSEQKQSNIGLVTDQQYNTGGITTIVGTKLILHFDGDYKNYEEQLRAGLARVMLDQMMYGGSFKDVIRNNTLLNLPEWYVEGLVSYLSTDWNTEINNEVKDAVMSGRWEKFGQLTGKDARYGGHSIWKYVVESYGESVISNILYMTRVSRNADNGFLFVLGVSLKNLAAEWLNYYDSMYYKQEDKQSLPEGKPLNRVRKRAQPYCAIEHPKLSPDGRKLAYVWNDMGKIRVKLRDLQSKKKKTIYRQGYRAYTKQDHSYPIVAWHPSGKLVSIITEHKGKIKLILYNLQTKKRTTRELFNFEKILSVDYSDDGREFVFTAVQMGKSDVFIYNIISNVYDKLTDDLFTDIDARFIDRSSKVIFSSDRNNDTIKQFDLKLLPKNLNHDIFIYDRKSNEQTLRRVTSTPFVDERAPMEYDGNSLSYLSDEQGVFNRYLAKLDSSIAYIDTSIHYSYFTRSRPLSQYPRSILEYDVDTLNGKIAEIIFAKGNYRLTVKDREAEKAEVLTDLGFSGFTNKAAEPPKKKRKRTSILVVEEQKPDTTQLAQIEQPNQSKPKDTGEINIYDYQFNSEAFQEKDVPQQTNEGSRLLSDDDPKSKRDKKREKVMARIDSLHAALEAVKDVNLEMQLPPQRNYDVAFKSEYVVTQLDNAFVNSTYQTFTGGGSFNNPGLNGFFKTGITDVLDDYKVVGGFRLTGNLKTNEVFVSAQNFKRRLDKQVIFHRQSIEDVISNSTIAQVYTYTLTYKVSWPFSDFSALRGNVLGRNDQTIYKSTNDRNLERPDDLQWTGGLKLEYVFDNTLPMGLNLYRGTRLKIFAEYFQEVDTDAKNLFVIGFDARNYIKVHRELIWANRLAASTSFGNQKIAYFLGGVDQWIAPTYNNDIPVDFTQNYGFQALATNMRGHPQNIRNGNSFAVINSELRWPIFRYLINRPIKSNFLYNFQIIGFGDIGTAWTGLQPFSEENSLNREEIQQGSILITVKNRREPIVGGFGLGARTKFLGYFIRVDYAWGVENRKINDGFWYISLSTDF